MQKSKKLIIIRKLAPLLTGAMLLMLKGCGGKPPFSYPEYPSQPAQIPQQERYQSSHGRAAALYSEARQEMTEGRYDKAELTLERALRIEPRNGYYWYSLAEVKYRRGNYPQAIQMALKSKSVSASDTDLIRRNDALIAAAQTKMGGK